METDSFKGNFEKPKRYELENIGAFFDDFQDYYNEVLAFNSFSDRESLPWFLKDSNRMSLSQPRFFWERYPQYTEGQLRDLESNDKIPELRRIREIIIEFREISQAFNNLLKERQAMSADGFMKQVEQLSDRARPLHKEFLANRQAIGERYQDITDKYFSEAMKRAGLA